MVIDALKASPDALTPRERLTVWILTLVVAITRWPAMSLTLWDWDEALFALALRDYDVAAHHPHPPGFPLFIALAKLIPAEPFHALQTVTVFSSLFVFPALFFLSRELRASTRVSIIAGLLLAFFPNVWFYGGTALSDVPSMVLVVIACALLLRGCRSDLSLLAGAALLAVAAGFRPQNLMIGAVPLLIAFAHRRRTAVAGAAMIAALLIVTYGYAARLSGGWEPYRDALARHESYIRNTDSFLAARHPGLIQVADDFFLRPYRAPWINAAVTLLAGVALLRRRGWLAVAIFGPFCVFAWLFLDYHSASRFSVAYMPLFAVLAAEGVPRRMQPMTAGALVALMAAWTWPALRVVHRTPSPPVAALEAMRSLGRGANVFVDERLGAHAEFLAPELHRQTVPIGPPWIADAEAVTLREGASSAEGALNFTRERERLAAIARPRYFEVSVLRGRRPAAAVTARTESSVATTSSRVSRPSSAK